MFTICWLTRCFQFLENWLPPRGLQTTFLMWIFKYVLCAGKYSRTDCNCLVLVRTRTLALTLIYKKDNDIAALIIFRPNVSSTTQASLAAVIRCKYVSTRVSYCHETNVINVKAPINSPQIWKISENKLLSFVHEWPLVFSIWFSSPSWFWIVTTGRSIGSKYKTFHHFVNEKITFCLCSL